MITLEKVCFAYEHEVALRYVDLQIEKGDSVAKIADDLLEDTDVIEKIYDIVKKNPEKTREEIWDFLMKTEIR